jgi:hypothetical protein
MLFKEIIAVYTENRTKQVQNAALLTVKADGQMDDTYSYHLDRRVGGKHSSPDSDENFLNPEFHAILPRLPTNKPITHLTALHSTVIIITSGTRLFTGRWPKRGRDV